MGNLEAHHHHDSNSSGHVHVARNKLKTGIILGFVVLAVEFIGGIWANSLALLADTAHMFTDVMSLIVAYFAMRAAEAPPSEMMTFGRHRITILAALFNAITLIAIVFYVGFEGYKRIMHPQPVEGTVIFISAAIGVIVNLYIGLGLRDQSENINIRSAMLHVLGDAVASAGVIVAGVIMYFTHWYFLDPIVSFFIALLVAFSAWRVLKETYYILMEATPKGIKFEEVVEAIRAVPNIKGVHDLHIWSLTSNRNAMTGHVVVDGELTINHTQKIIQELESTLANQFNIGHITVQVENDIHQQEDMFSIDREWS